MRTIRDVAQVSGFGVGTVSRALNGHPNVDPQTRARIEAAAAKIGYTSNGLARALRSRQSHVVGLVVPDLTNAYYGVGSAFLQDELAAAGYQLLVCCSNDDPDTERSLLRSLVGRRVDGVALVPATPEGGSFIRESNPSLPIVEFARRSRDKGVDSVGSDESHGAGILITYLLERGHTGIGMIAGPPTLNTTRARVTGFRTRIRNAGLNPDSCPVVHVPYNVESAKSATTALINLEGITAVFASASMFVVGAYEAIAEAGLEIPRDLSVVGFQNPDWFAIAAPPVTTYELPLKQMGVEAARLLLARMRLNIAGEEQVEPTHIRIPGRFVARDSVSGARPNVRSAATSS